MKNNVLKFIFGILTKNIGLKLLAAIMSCGLWFMVNTITDPIEKKPFYNIPVEIINEDEITSNGKVYEVLDGTNFVNVTVIGKHSVFENITRDDIKAVADMSQLSFMNTVGIQVYSTRNNSELDFTKNIENMKLSIESKKSIQKGITASTSGEPAGGYVVEKAGAVPNVVRFSGPESVIDQIDHVEAVANIDYCTSDISTSVDLKIYDAANNEIKNSSIKMNISTVNVSVSILATKEVPLLFTVPDTPAAGYIVSEPLLSDPGTLLIAGRSSVLDGISKITISDPALSVEDQTEDMTAVVNIKKYLPSGVQFADSKFNGNVSVTVGIEKLITKELEIPARNFAAGDKPEGFNVTLKETADAGSYKISISGTRAAVDQVDAESVIGVVDMRALKETLGLQEWAAGIYQGDIVFKLPDSVELAQDYKMTVVLEELDESVE